MSETEDLREEVRALRERYDRCMRNYSSLEVMLNEFTKVMYKRIGEMKDEHTRSTQQGCDTSS